MTPGWSEQASAAPTQRVDALAELDRLRAQLRLAECKVRNLEGALRSSGRIGVAMGIFMCQHRTTEEQTFDLLRARSQNNHVKVRGVAEKVARTGAL